jgi:hypothetical protein
LESIAMAVRMSQVKSVCTANEVALVAASRKPLLETLSPAELKRSARRARTLFDKWQGQARTQARAKRQKEGFGEEQARTQSKVDIFQEALRNFEKRLATVEKASAGKGARGKSAGGKPKKARSAGHRSARADVRSQLAEPPMVPRPKKPALTGIQKKLAADLGQQQSATAAATKSRVTQSGLTSRVRGHVSARGRRAQGRRDSKNA